MTSLRPYQVEQVDSVIRELASVRSTLCVAPTGTGKTVTFASLVRRFAEERKRSLVLAHREELIQQAAAKVRQWGGVDVEVERAQDYASIDRLYGGAFAVVASVQTLRQPRRLHRFSCADFGLIVVDEAHHALKDNSYGRILDYFSEAKVSGWTATPDRHDEQAMGQVFQTVAHVYEVLDAIKDGWISEPRQHRVVLEDLDLSTLRTRKGDFAEEELDRIMRDEKHLHAVAGPIVEHSGDRPTLVFGVTVEHARLLADQLNRRKPGQAAWLCGESCAEERRNQLWRFANGDFQYLCNCSLFTEGTDIPRVACVAVARPTKSRMLYTQMLGRGFRLSPETGKTDCLVLDFAGNAGKHHLVTTTDVLAGERSPKVQKVANEIAAQEQERLTGREILERAEAEVARQTQAEMLLERRKHLIAASRSRLQAVDPFGLHKARIDWAGKEITDGQRALIRRLGLKAWKREWGPFPNRQAASVLIEALKAKRQARFRRTG